MTNSIEYQRQYYREHRERILARNRVRYELKKPDILKQQRESEHQKIYRASARYRASRCTTQRKYREKNLEVIKTKAREYWSQLPPAVRAERSRKTSLKRKYGLTPEAYALMVQKQNGTCAICGNPGRLNIDHCHLTGKVRGLLCIGCNTAIGSMKEDLQTFQAAVQYLTLNSAP